MLSHRCSGRPKVDVSADEIISLRSLNFKWSKIASLLGVSRATLYRRLNEYGIAADDCTQLSDAQLDDIIVSIKGDHPHDGEILLKGHLCRLGIRVRRKDLRASIHRVDHEGAVRRRANLVKRRVYSVPHPNAIWHIDTHHKLIRWRLIIHASIDGYSRTIVYAFCANNNKASTAVEGFKDGVSDFGLPQCVRSDHGGENVDVWRFMLAAHNNDISCVITGSSTHNERIERLWRDVHRCVGRVFSPVFYELEANNYLDPLNEVDLYLLHYVYMPRINKCLTDFKTSWNHHSLSSEGNFSPYQLFYEGSTHSGDYDLDVSLSSASVSMLTAATEAVEVSRMAFTPCPAMMNLLSTVNPMQQCQDHGKMLYIQCVQLSGQHLQSNCTECIHS